MINTNGKSALELILILLAIILSIFGALCLAAWIVMLVWNAFCPPVFGAPDISFWQAFAGWILASMVLGIIKRSK